MQYRNTPRFQFVLQVALSVLAQEKGYSDQKLISTSKLDCSKSTLNRFRLYTFEVMDNRVAGIGLDTVIDRVGGSYLNGRDARKLWSFLDEQGIIEKALALKGIRKQELYQIQDVANAMLSFYDTHQSSMERFTDSGVTGNFFCYKPSFRRQGFVVKSIMSLRSVKKDYFEVKERQRVSGTFEMDGRGIEEVSEGFALIKSERVWIFLRDIETEQPRIFCFYKPKFSQRAAHGHDTQKQKYVSRISSMNGYLIEGSKGNENNAFSFNVVLIAEDVDKDLWSKRNPEGTFDVDDQIDVYPASDAQISRYQKQMMTKNFFIPEEIVEYLDIK